MGQDGREDGRSPFALWSAVLGIAGILLLSVPAAGLAAGVVAIVLGGISLRRGEDRRHRAVAGIVTGCCLVLMGAVLVFCMSALRPYEDDLEILFRNTLNQLR